MLYKLIRFKTAQWLNSDECSVKELVKYIRTKNELRLPQIEAIETYLFLKIKCQNKPLWKLFSEGFFTNGTDLEELNINQIARKFLNENTNALALFEFSRQKNGNSTLAPSLEKEIISNPEKVNYSKIIKDIFYNVSYADYLLSLPMGAGKTFLMSAFIFLDLYFAKNEPENKIFAHNFLVLIPSGLKSSIIPSLRNIETFDASWVLPEPSASEIKKVIKFEVLDQPKSASKSSKAENPNSAKVNLHFPNPFGCIFVVNAEKVILNRLKLDKNQEVLWEETEDEKDRLANELRNLIGKIPNLSIFIDEVHHAATDEIKLRQVVNRWNSNGNITTVLGFSGTPYLAKSDKIFVSDEVFLKFSQITNTVYHFPLTEAIRTFLKVPQVKVAENMERLQVIEKGIEDFDQNFKNKIYSDGTIPKIAIYCATIEFLEEEVFPFLIGTLKINPNEILKFHRGNKTYKLPKENELEFASLDQAFSKKRYVLLVQIGKEGWDCKSLTAVVLSQKGDSPKNMVLQTSCRCLRQVDKNSHETALIWLNDYNAKILNSQLKNEQNTSIEDINKLQTNSQIPLVERFPRTEKLNLPKIDFYQLEIAYNSFYEEISEDTESKLQNLYENLEDFKVITFLKKSTLEEMENAEISKIRKSNFKRTSFNTWLFEISKESFSKISVPDLKKHNEILTKIFKKITTSEEGEIFFDSEFDTFSVNSKIRNSFAKKRTLETKSDVLKEEASLLLIEKLSPVEQNEKLFPENEIVQEILEFDKQENVNFEELETKGNEDFEKAKKLLIEQGLGNLAETLKVPQTVSTFTKNKDKTFHYLPYNFVQSGFEKQVLETILKLEDFRKNGLEIYYNGERGLTEFVIKCFEKSGKNWKNVGKYTTDFLVLKRQNDQVHKVLILETKGKGFENDPNFVKRKNFVSTDFLEQNKEKFGYDKFDFLYISESQNEATNTMKIIDKITNFFT